jgi:hypothetical protein
MFKNMLIYSLYLITLLNIYPAKKIRNNSLNQKVVARSYVEIIRLSK